MKRHLGTFAYIFILFVILILLVFYYEKKESKEFLSDSKILDYKDKYEKELSKKPYDDDLLIKLSLIEMKLGNYQKANILIDKNLFENSLDEISLNIKGILLLIDEKYDEAELYFLKSISSDDTNYITYVYLALINTKKGESEKVKRYLDKAKSINYYKTVKSLRGISDTKKIYNDSFFWEFEEIKHEKAK